MKSWFIFGSGIFLGLVLGTLLTAFVLFDDVSGKSRGSAEKKGSSANTAAVKKQSKEQEKSREIQTVSTNPVAPESKPQAVTAEAVSLDDLSEPSLSTVKRDDAPASPAAH